MRRNRTFCCLLPVVRASAPCTKRCVWLCSIHPIVKPYLWKNVEIVISQKMGSDTWPQHLGAPAAGGPCKRILYKTLCLMVFHPPNHETIFVAEFWDSYLSGNGLGFLTSEFVRLLPVVRAGLPCTKRCVWWCFTHSIMKPHLWQSFEIVISQKMGTDSWHQNLCACCRWSVQAYPVPNDPAATCADSNCFQHLCRCSGMFTWPVNLLTSFITCADSTYFQHM